jgi:hypothetical protein
VPTATTETKLAPYWQEYPGTPTRHWMGAMNSTILQARTMIATNFGPLLSPPIMTATLVANVSEGNFFAQNIDGVCSGLSPLRIRPSNSVDTDGITAQN